jgi:type IV fimbrial biogenesis protein FimT
VGRQGNWRDERGFTLIEVMATIIVMGILFTIATFTWTRAAEVRRVDSATNQVVADLRLAHTQATNRLTDSSFVVPADSVPAGVDPLSTYQVGPPGDLDTMRLPGDDQGIPKTKILADTNIVFESNGGATTPTGDPPGEITVTTTDGDPTDPSHTIQINPITSRVKVVS